MPILQIHKMNDMLKSWLSIGLVTLVMVSCNESDSNTETQKTSDEPVEVQVENSTDNKASNDVNITAPATELNPAHGEPGHDCAIPVGAPLDGSGAKNEESFYPPTTIQPVAQPNSQVQEAPADGLNPPHGEPGHDCAVAVGAPLPAQ